MSAVDDGFKIKLGLDTQDAEKEINNLDDALQHTVEKMDCFLEAFQNNLTLVFASFGQAQGETAKGLQEEFLRQQISLTELQKNREVELAQQREAGRLKREQRESDKQAALERREEKDDQKRKRQDEEAKKETEKKKALAYEKQRGEQQKEQIERQNRIVAGIRDMGVALAGVVKVGLTLRKALDFSDGLTRTGLHLKAMGMDATEYFQTRNVLRKRGIEDGAYMAALGSQQEIYTTLMTSGTGALNDDQRKALGLVAKYNHTLMDPLSSKMSFAQWSAAINAGAADFKKDEQTGIPEIARNRYMKALFGNDLDLTEAISAGISKKELAAEYAHAKKEADNLKSAGRITAANQERQNITEANMAGLLGKAVGPAERFFNAMNAFLDRYGEMTLMAEAVLSLVVALGGWSAARLLGKGGLSATKMLGKGGKKLFNSAKRKMGSRAAEAGAEAAAGVAGEVAAGAASRGAAAAGVAGEAAAASAGDVAGELLLKGLLKGGLGEFMLVYDLSGGIPSTSATDDIIHHDPTYNDPARVRQRKRFEEIERKLQGVIQPAEDGKYMITDANGNSIIFTEDETISTLQARMKQKIEANNNRSWWDYIFPSAHAAEPVNSMPAGQMTGSQDENARIMMKILMKEGGFSREAAAGIIASKIGESGLNPAAVGDNGTSFGIAQWHTQEQKEAFKRLFGHDLQHSTLEEQVRFIIWEMNHTYKKAGDAIRKAKTADEATAADVKYYEMPANIEGETAKRMGYIAAVNRAINQPFTNIPPTNFAQMQWQGKARQIERQVNNSTVNNQAGNTTQTMTNNIHIDARGGDLDRLKKSVQQAVRFPDATMMNGVSGVG